MRLDLPDFRLEVYLGEWEFKARHHLTASDAETMTVAELLALAAPDEREAFESLPLSYVPVPGGEELREAIASTYESVDASQVLAFAGAEEAMFWALQELAGPGEHAIVTVPNYQSTESVPLAAGADVSGLLLRPENGWGLDLEELESLLRPETRLVVVNFPNNPTGGVASQEAFRGLVELCDERGIRLLSDEVYRGVELDPARTLPQAADLSETALSLNVMSKAYGLPGLRIGWLACRDRELLARLERRKHYTSICNAGPSEALATIALRNGEALRARTRATLAENLPLFDGLLHRVGGAVRVGTAGRRVRVLPALSRRRRRRGLLPGAPGGGRRRAPAGRHLRLDARRRPGGPVPHRARAPQPGAGAGGLRRVPTRSVGS